MITHTTHKSHLLHTLGVRCSTFLFLFTLFLLFSCNKMPMNGVLDGNWQLISIETPEGRRDVKDSLVFLSIQLQLSQWTDYPRGKRFFSHFIHRGDSILFYDIVHPSPHSLNENNDFYVTAEEMDKGLMNAWGIHTLDARYHLKTATYSDLVLEKEDTILSFRKF